MPIGSLLDDGPDDGKRLTLPVLAIVGVNQVPELRGGGANLGPDPSAVLICWRCSADMQFVRWLCTYDTQQCPAKQSSTRVRIPNQMASNA